MHSRFDDFSIARVRLTILYILTVTVILAAFSVAIYFFVGKELHTLARTTETSLVSLPVDETYIIGATLPGGSITETEFVLLGDTFASVYEVSRAEEEVDVYVDPKTGIIIDIEDDTHRVESYGEAMINDFVETLIIANVVMLFLVGSLSYLFAGKTLRPIKHKMEQQTQFSSDVAHEIRTPLSAILATTEAALRKPQTIEVYKETLMNVQKEARRLSTLSEDLLLSANGRAEQYTTYVSLKDVAEQAMQHLKLYAAEQEVTCSLTVTENTSVLGNQVMLERMLENILHNAVMYSPHRGTIEIELHKKTLTITDHGSGISAADQGHIFERFYRGDKNRDERTMHGSGLGLAIVKQIANLHNAHVTLTSAEDVGTTVTITFLQ